MNIRQAGNRGLPRDAMPIRASQQMADNEGCGGLQELAAIYDLWLPQLEGGSRQRPRVIAKTAHNGNT